MTPSTAKELSEAMATSTNTKEFIMTTANNITSTPGSESCNAIQGGGNLKITNTRRNCMGTTSFEAKFKGMRKTQEFIVYPIKAGDDTKHVTIQSDTRIGYLTFTGGVHLCPPISSGAYAQHLANVAHIDTLSTDELSSLQAHIMKSANPKAGTNGMVYTDNSGASRMLSGVSA
jgi:hypothetical protein